MIDLRQTPYHFWYFHGIKKLHICRSWNATPLCDVVYPEVQHSWGVSNKTNANSGVCKKCLDKFYLAQLAE